MCIRDSSDRGLNANLWNLSAEAGKSQGLFYSVLLQATLEKINREMPGCSISVQAPVSSFESLEDIGFILDPNGLAAEKGVRLGDVLVEVDQTKVQTAVAVKTLITKIIESKNKKSVLFTINRQGSLRFLGLRVTE